LRAPELTGGGPWINSEPLALKQLTGKAVLIDFWTYSCVNCLRTLPRLIGWYDKYREFGLEVIGVHTPEFDFEKSPENVAWFVSDRGIDYPIVLDNDRLIWTAYANRYWPRKYLLGPDGFIKYDHIGEGGYAETEAMIRRLLSELAPQAELPPADSDGPDSGDGGTCGPATAETYCGFERGRLGNPQGYQLGVPVDYTDPRTLEDGVINLQGLWLAEDEYLVHARYSAEFTDYLALSWHGVEVNAVMASENEPSRVDITVDGQAVDQRVAGADVTVEAGRGSVLVDRPRMFQLFKADAPGNWVLKISPAAAGLRIYAFTFGGCN
jgi:thiol-disulfide isomerase/thioredoxin